MWNAPCESGCVFSVVVVVCIWVNIIANTTKAVLTPVAIHKSGITDYQHMLYIYIYISVSLIFELFFCVIKSAILVKSVFILGSAKMGTVGEKSEN